jgi:ribonuclease PH
MNVVMTGRGQFVEVQGTGEDAPFSRRELDDMLALAESGIQRIIEEQRKVLGPISDRIRGTQHAASE